LSQYQCENTGVLELTSYLLEKKKLL